MAKRILVKNRNGQLGEIPVEQAREALSEGYQLATPDEAKEQSLQGQYGDGLGTEIRAGLEGAARGLSIGTSDAILQGLGADQEGLRERKERNPVAAGVGEVAGIAAPLAVSALAGPAGPAGVAGAIAARTPVALLARGTLAAGEAAAGALEGTRAAQVLGKALAPAVGSAIEGAAYGLGQSVSEEALGDPGLSAERLVSNVGLGGLFGGALGGVFGAFNKAPVATILDDEIRAVGDGVINPNNIEDVARASGIDEGYIASLGKKRAGAQSTEAAAQELGAPVTVGMIGGKEAQILEDMVRSSGSAPAQAYAKQLDEGFEIAQKAVAESFGEASGKSMAEVGDELSTNLINKFEDRTRPFEIGYDKVRESTKNIQVSDKSKLRIAKNIEALKVNNYSASEKTLINDVIQNLETTTSLEGLRSIKTGINKAAASDPTIWGIVGDISERIDGFIERSAKKAVAELPPGALREEGRQVFKELDRLKSDYKPFREGINKLSSALFGGKKINGPRHFISEMQKMKPEAFAKKLFTKENSRHLKFMADNFPEETRLLTRYVKDDIFRKSGQIKGDMARMNSIFKSVDNLEKEAKAFLFTPDELAKIKAAETYLRAFPAKFNGSNTAHAADRMQFWSSPVSAATITARDFAMVQALKGLGPRAENQVKALSTMERMIQKTTRGIEMKSKSIIRGTQNIMREVPAGALGAGAIPREEQRKEERKTLDLIQRLTADPEEMVTRLDDATKDVAEFAPKTAQSMALSASQAVSFLASKAPQRPNMGPLSPQYEFSDSEVAKFQRYSDVVEDPLSILDQVESGTLTMEAMETITQVYPGMYQDMKMQLMENIADLGEGPAAMDMPYATKMCLSMFMGQDLVASLGAQSIAMNQMVLAQTGQQQETNIQGPKPTQKGLSEIGNSDRMFTPMQRSNLRMES